MMYIDGNLNDPRLGEFSLGIHSQNGQNQDGEEFYEIVVGFLFFELVFGVIKE